MGKQGVSIAKSNRGRAGIQWRSTCKNAWTPSWPKQSRILSCCWWTTAPPTAAAGCDKLAERDGRIRVIHQENQGLGGARNTGIQAAVGDWLLLVDSDDWIEPQTLKKALEAGLREKLTWWCSATVRWTRQAASLQTFWKRRPRTGLSPWNSSQTCCSPLLPPASACTAGELLARTGILFPSRVWYEDMRTTPKLLAQSKQVVFLDFVGYNYFQRTGSITKNQNAERNREILDAFEDLLSWFRAQGLLERYRQELCYLAVYHAFLTASVRVLLIDRKHPLLREFRESLERWFPDWRQCPYLSRLSRSHRLLLSPAGKALLWADRPAVCRQRPAGLKGDPMNLKLKWNRPRRGGLLENTVMLYILQFSNMALGLLTQGYQMRVLGLDNVGVLSAAQYATNFFQILIDFGFIYSATAKVSRFREDKNVLNKVLTCVILAKAMFMAVSFLILFAFIAPTLPDMSQVLVYAFYLISVCTYALLPDFMYRGLEQMSTITIRAVAIKFFATLMIFLFVHQPGDYFLVPLFTAVGNLGAIVFVYWHLFRRVGIHFCRVTWREIWVELKDSSQFFLSKVAASINSNLNGILLSSLAGPAATGLYANADKVIGAAKSGMSPLRTACTPHMMKHKNFSLIKKAMLIVYPVILLGCAVVFLFAEPLLCSGWGQRALRWCCPAAAHPCGRVLFPQLCAGLPHPGGHGAGQIRQHRRGVRHSGVPAGGAAALVHRGHQPGDPVPAHQRDGGQHSGLPAGGHREKQEVDGRQPHPPMTHCRGGRIFCLPA